MQWRRGFRRLVKFPLRQNTIYIVYKCILCVYLCNVLNICVKYNIRHYHSTICVHGRGYIIMYIIYSVYTTSAEVTYPLESQAGATSSGGMVSGTYDPIIHIITTDGTMVCVCVLFV